MKSQSIRLAERIQDTTYVLWFPAATESGLVGNIFDVDEINHFSFAEANGCVASARVWLRASVRAEC